MPLLLASCGSFGEGLLMGLGNMGSYGGGSNYYVYKDGTIRCPYVDPRDGLDRSAIPELAVYSESLSCAELTVLAAPLYIAESFDSELLESLTEAGVLAYYQADGKLCVTGG